jgi:FtsH-binding integral membrane protein
MDRYNPLIHNEIALNQEKFALDEKTLMQEVSKVFIWMFFGLLVTSLTSTFAIVFPDIYLDLMNGFMGMVILFAPLVFVFLLVSRINKYSASKAATMFVVFSILEGLQLGYIFFMYSFSSIISTFLVTSITFLIMGIYGFTTKTDLTKFSKLFMFALVGIIISSLLNIFLFKSTGFDLIISGIGVILFTGLIAYDTQKIKESITYYYATEGKNSGRGVILGALNLYLDFINLFLFLLRFLGDRD